VQRTDQSAQQSLAEVSKSKSHYRIATAAQCMPPSQVTFLVIGGCHCAFPAPSRPHRQSASANSKVSNFTPPEPEHHTDMYRIVPSMSFSKIAKRHEEKTRLSSRLRSQKLPTLGGQCQPQSLKPGKTMGKPVNSTCTNIKFICGFISFRT